MNETKKQGNKETRKQGNKETRKQGNKEVKKERKKEIGFLFLFYSSKNVFIGVDAIPQRRTSTILHNVGSSRINASFPLVLGVCTIKLFLRPSVIVSLLL